MIYTVFIHNYTRNSIYFNELYTLDFKGVSTFVIYLVFKLVLSDKVWMSDNREEEFDRWQLALDINVNSSSLWHTNSILDHWIMLDHTEKSQIYRNS